MLTSHQQEPMHQQQWVRCPARSDSIKDWQTVHNNGNTELHYSIVNAISFITGVLFSNPKTSFSRIWLRPEFLNPAGSGSDRIWKSQIWCNLMRDALFSAQFQYWKDFVPYIPWHWVSLASCLLSAHSWCMAQLWNLRDGFPDCCHEWCLQKTFVADMKDAVLYSEKFISSKFRPSLSNYGGKAIDGFIAVTASGLVCNCHLL